MSAIKCQRCNNKTTNPSGFCHLHENSAKADGDAPPSALASPPSMSQDSGPSLNDREVIIEEADLHFSQITSAEPKSDDVDRMTFHDNGVVTMENDAGELLVYNRIDEGDMERPDIRDEMVDNWMEREHDDYAHQGLAVSKDSPEAYEIRANAGRDDFRAYTVGFRGGANQGYSYTTDEGKYIQRRKTMDG